MMTNIHKIFKEYLPNKKIFYRLQDLLDSILNKKSKERILLSIEKLNYSREYCELTLDELELIYVIYPKINRTFYECICENMIIKTYIDFEYLLENNSFINCDKAIISCLKIMFFFLNNSLELNISSEINLSAMLNQFLVLNASTLSKKSYHFIHANPTVLFGNSKTLGLYIRKLFQSLLFAVAKHTCVSFNLSIGLEVNSIQDIISVLSPYLAQLRMNCSNCFISNHIITVADIINLIVYNKRKQLILAVDLHVYSKNQQFRLYDSIKNGQNNPLITTSDYPFDHTKYQSYFDILRKSLITNIDDRHVPLILLENEQFFIKSTYSKINQKPIHIVDTNLKNNDKKQLNDQTIRSNLSLLNKQGTKLLSVIQKQQNRAFNNTIFESYIPFINNMITMDNKHIGKIQSCVQGNLNTNKLFFNITGNYRFCPKIGTHHKRNSTAIIIDMSNNTFAIRCKDPNCDNSSLIWHFIDKQ